MRQDCNYTFAAADANALPIARFHILAGVVRHIRFVTQTLLADLALLADLVQNTLVSFLRFLTHCRINHCVTVTSGAQCLHSLLRGKSSWTSG